MKSRVIENSISGDLRAGDWVEVRSQEEILATLDGRGCLDNMPFMPEMLKHCGNRFRVYKRADKTCDTLSEGKRRSRRVRDAVHLANVRCEGEFHDDCDNTCLIFWKEAWLKRVGGFKTPADFISIPLDSGIDGANKTGKCTVEDLLKAARSANATPGEEEIYSCQATELVRATSPLRWWDIRQYWRDFASGNVGIVEWEPRFCICDIGSACADFAAQGLRANWDGNRL